MESFSRSWISNIYQDKLIPVFEDKSESKINRSWTALILAVSKGLMEANQWEFFDITTNPAAANTLADNYYR